MALQSFNALHLTQYIRGLLTQNQMLIMYPAETTTTLSDAVTKHTAVHG